MEYCAATPSTGLKIRPNTSWNGDKDFLFDISGFSDSDFAKDPERRRSVSGYAVFLNGALISTTSRMQSCVTLSVTEAELVAATECAQDMLYAMRFLKSIRLKVKLLMPLHVDSIKQRR